MATPADSVTREDLRAEFEGLRAELREHYATKADQNKEVGRIETELARGLGRVEIKQERMMWMLLAAMVTVMSLVIAVLRIVGVGGGGA